MSRYARDKQDSFRPAPVKRVEVDGKHTKLRFLLVAFFLAVAVVAFAYFGMQALSTDPGWKEVEVQSADGNTVAPEFTFYYNLGYSGISATAEYKSVQAAYAQMTETAYKLFNAYEDFEGIANLHTLSTHPEEPQTLDPALYGALEQILASGDRSIYLAPVYAQYHDLFFCSFDFETEEYDPFVNPEAAASYAEICRFANDADHVNLELLGENRAVLHASAEYLAYAKDNGFDTLLDLYWMKNAFVVDYLAENLTAKGFTLGTVSSNDGFCRVLDPTEAVYSTDILDWAGKGAYKAAAVQLQGPVATLSLHTYDLFGNEEKRYYKTGDDRLLHPYVDPVDGLCKAALNDLVVYSKEVGCGEMLLSVLPQFRAERFDQDALLASCAGKMDLIYCQNQKILYTEPGAEFANVFTSEALSYIPTIIK